MQVLVLNMSGREMEFEIIRSHASKLSEAEKIIYFEQKKKDEAIGLILALLFSGIGQIYAGKTVRGILCFIFSWLIVPWIYAIIDTYKTIKDYNARLYTAIFGESK